MPILSMFFGIIVRMHYQDHNPPHFHAEFQGKRAVFDFKGNVLSGDLGSKTATKLVREWVDLHTGDLIADWELATEGKELRRIAPLD